ncbi:MAG: sugar ABC transporter permease [Chelatococcus sp.]|jgi:raffinose/stachyose/melibiose transport system permease protein|uniref:carbohydrate ABC transporter permease n=1 Tax=unclassified Chelatococcus TaxID=2638111 RepID=UPI001BCB85D4|nr:MULTISPECIES: sugar ABC transporter permease [unclassified Chelatococcus]CAH1658689.1 ABC transmembrane type-1 domain-containing protein [Hyphomicrobiales bacterium]MBS7742137.1 sugar ABC transporter permease [Chelatococcus sp. HY11]MBX3538495.1 sugar ABC transporter permease [Chelatococcus sp.]MBX3542745.1 sugar ABC transporter permease [Chelatococcus sp.]MCO5075039.1 sugar ABC transporter permease [Chelatococcus sp.]
MSSIADTADFPTKTPSMRKTWNFGGLFNAGLSWWFVIPALMLYCLIIVYPMLSGTGYAFTNWNGLTPDYSYVGFANFQRMFGDPQAMSAISTTLIMAFALVAGKIIVGLLLALALDSEIKSRNFLRMIFFMPVVLTPVIMSFSWKYIFSTTGALNQIIKLIGPPSWAQQWLGEPTLALFSVIFVTGWGSVGLAMVIFLAGLQGVPKELIEAAKIDGASSSARLRYIILPLLAPAMTVNVVIGLVQGLKFFDQIYVLTGGGPGYATETLSTIIYKTSFQFGEYGYGSATALVFALLVAAIVFAATHILRRREIPSG